jgi:DNA-binding response OmpR family regulator
METADKRPHVVVLEDDRDVAELVREILDDSGFDTMTADHNTPAEVVAGHRPRLLLMDLLLGDREGRDIVASLRRAGLGQVPLVLMSGRQELDREMRALGAVAALAKPFDIEELIGTCRGLVAAEN